MKIVITKNKLLLMEYPIDLYKRDFQLLAGKDVNLGKKIELIEELRDACEEFLETQSQELMKKGDPSEQT